MQFEIEHSPPPVPERRNLWQSTHDLLRVFSPSERLALYVLSITLALSAFVLLAEVNNLVSNRIPAAGGTLVEGGVGVPRFVNPVLATTPIDQDLTTLIYSGLLRPGSGGEYVPDAAYAYDISEDGTIYTFHLREGLTFHDGEPLTSADVLFTVALAQNPDIKSPRRADWEGVAVAAPDEHTVVFTLPHAYAPFLENATLGILPRHVWADVAAEEFPFHALNTRPIGSGPYALSDAVFDSTGAPTAYKLEAFSDFALGSPHISTIVYRAYPNEDALRRAAEDGDIDSFVAASPKTVPRELQEQGEFIRIPQTRVFGIFLNQNHAPVLTDASVRHALDAAVDKESLVGQILGGFGSALHSPIPYAVLPGSVAGAASSSAPGETEDRAEAARQILSRGGWTYSEQTASTSAAWTKGETTLSITLATADAEELVATAHAVAEAWRAIGVPTEVQIYPLQEFTQNVLRPRQYDAILFGEAVGRSLDLFPFWHSSQRNDPGLNLSLYTNADADRILASARASTDREKRETLIRDFLETIAADDPAVFLYSPEIAYLVPSYLQGIEIGPLSTPSERFWGVHEWYRDTERVWDIFTQ
ncbi:MAG TPA: ABC transporter substrate-binding protein [Candidatus Paceibacterota bacterium]|nr:ABC transporter substrate-binding protein [Candidatus Paceibacterota bacterium]